MSLTRVQNSFPYSQVNDIFLFSSSTRLDVGATNYTCRTPVGVAGLISPWNLPLYLLTFKLAPALAAGCTVVCKPSEMTSHTAHMFAQACADAGRSTRIQISLFICLFSSGVPPGVVNIVFGTGPRAGEALVTHPDVPIISFTGSTLVGKHIQAVSAPYIKKLSLEVRYK